jgi:D-xylose transport system substrate-binding protein
MPDSERIAGRVRLGGLAILAAALACVVVIVLFSCRSRRHRVEPGRVPRIGFSMDSLVVERWQRDIDVFSRSARDLGAELLLEVADQDPAVQERQVRDLVQRGIDVLVIVPNDADRLSAVVAEVKARGIPVLSYDRLVRNAGVDLYLSFDNEKVGSLMAESVVRRMPQGGNVVIINGARNDYNAVMLNRGMHQVLDPRVAAGKLRITAESWPESWDSDNARTRMEALVAKDRHLDAVIAGNDMLAEAVIGVLTENRLGKVKVAGQDADLAACQRIAEGSQYATIYKPIDRLALKAAGFAVMLARGEPITTDATIDDGLGRVPYARLEPILVTRGLLDATVIKDGFHTAADVYRNVRR